METVEIKLCPSCNKLFEAKEGYVVKIIPDWEDCLFTAHQSLKDIRGYVTFR